MFLLNSHIAGMRCNVPSGFLTILEHMWYLYGLFGPDVICISPLERRVLTMSIVAQMPSI